MPGSISQTRTGWSNSSRRSDIISEWTAAFTPQYPAPPS